MYIVAIAWLYVALMMAAAEAASSNGTVLGALVTLTLYGLLPVALLMYIMGTPGRKRALRARQAAELEAARAAAAAGSGQPDAGGQAPADPVASVRKEP